MFALTHGERCDEHYVAKQYPGVSTKPEVVKVQIVGH